MTTPNEDEAAPAYTRASVLAYLKAAEEERQRIRLAIAEARYRKEVAMSRVDRIGSLGSDYSLWNGTKGDSLVLTDGVSNEQSQWSDASNGVDWVPIDPVVEVARD